MCPGGRPSNNLPVFYGKHHSGEKRGIAVCSKGLSQLEDVSLRIIEWIELLRALGVDKIILPILAVHSNVMKVMMSSTLKLDRGSMRSSPRFGLSTNYRSTTRNSAEVQVKFKISLLRLGG